ncbi:MAG: DUF748 domain-containing protein, partial [Deltaproteobacteria bacterium]
GLMVKDRESTETFLSLDEVLLNVEIVSLFRMAPVLKEIRLTAPYVRIVRHQDLSYNFSDLLEKKEPSPPVQEKTAPFRFSLNNITIEKGSIDFVDGPKETKHAVRELRIGIPFLSNIPSHVELFVKPQFSASINDSLYTIQGQTKPFADSLETYLDIDIRDLSIPHYLAYVPLKMSFSVPSAFLDTQARVSFIQTKGNTSSLQVAGKVSLKKLAVDDNKNGPILRLPLLDVGIAASEPLAGNIHLSKVSIESPELEIRRDKEGRLNANSLLPEDGGAKKPPPEKVEESQPLNVTVDEVLLTGGKVSLWDLSQSKPFKTILDPIDLKVDHFSNGKEKKSAYTLSLRTEAKEALRVEGEFTVDPLTSEGTIEVSSVPLGKYSPFYQDKVLFQIADGRLDLSTRYRFVGGQKEPDVGLSGLSVVLSALRLKRAGENEDFLAVPALSVKETELNLAKKELRIGSFSTQKGKVSVKRLQNGDVDLLKLVPPEPALETPPKQSRTEATSAASQPPWLVSLKQMLVSDYTVLIDDRTNSDPVALSARKIRLKGDNISTKKNSKGRIALDLLLNDKGAVSMVGNAGLEPLAADLKMGLKGIYIAPFQPYFTDRVKIRVTDGALSTNGN